METQVRHSNSLRGGHIFTGSRAEIVSFNSYITPSKAVNVISIFTKVKINALFFGVGNISKSNQVSSKKLNYNFK